MTNADDNFLQGGAIEPVARDSLTRIVYNNLRVALMEGRFWPGHRFKIRELAASMHVSETPIREALMQLVRARALELIDGRSIIVAHMSLAQYLELRTIRLFLEGLAAENATPRIGDDGIDQMAALHQELVAAEAEGRWSDAVRANWRFHHRLYEAAEMPELLAILDDIWMRNGPLLNYHYPHAAPTYPGPHEHLHILERLRARDGAGVRDAVQTDMRQGGVKLVQLLESVGDTRKLARDAVPHQPPPRASR
ncbi:MULTISPECIES: GntR family transcriptional regulator [unclassified Bosea (in: a-proteobacteria)]|uniref:GntR family transcriptional regulator n=1 Tax=unclassified Bosea (in: a-proteobacteria) TaxID=2653178 RepID=UPI0009552E83|nr:MULTISPECIES: GntR family transcriptional regulator [unclassified Bosea (in: a-proteobacteria)]SIP88939.1 transcriptional regulator, GntR family [Bosea sp. TND4EK4]